MLMAQSEESYRDGLKAVQKKHSERQARQARQARIKKAWLPRVGRGAAGRLDQRDGQAAAMAGQVTTAVRTWEAQASRSSRPRRAEQSTGAGKDPGKGH